MLNGGIGFVGSGRVTRFMLSGFKRKGEWPRDITVSDVNAEVLNQLKQQFPGIEVTPDNQRAAAKDIVFLALHPPALKEGLAGIASRLKKSAVLISLAPKFTIAMLSSIAGGFNRIVRIIPNAPSVVNAGFNPVVFSRAFAAREKKELLEFLGVLGQCPEVAEDKLEAYAMLTAMGPTYLWFQLNELQDIGKSFGMTADEASAGISKMTEGALKAFYESGLSPAEVMDLVPLKPLGDDEEAIKTAYRTKLEGLYRKLKG
jgi:pyrroline-5-carboxylate reductase